MTQNQASLLWTSFSFWCIDGHIKGCVHVTRTHHIETLIKFINFYESEPNVAYLKFYIRVNY